MFRAKRFNCLSDVESQEKASWTITSFQSYKIIAFGANKFRCTKNSEDNMTLTNFKMKNSLSAPLLLCISSVIATIDIQHSLELEEWKWTKPSWWQAYRQAYSRTHLLRCDFLNGIIPTHDSVCVPKQTEWYMCLFGNQQCQVSSTDNNSMDHPKSRCDCRTNGNNDWKWNCYDLEPCIHPSPLPTQDPTEVPSTIPNRKMPQTSLTIGAYYYPWYDVDFHGSHYLRDELSPKQVPLLGKYDDRDPSVIAQHLTWSRYANIGLWVTSWWGPGSREDITTLKTILPHSDLGSHKIALFYEMEGRILAPSYSTEQVTPDISHICKNHFSHPNYYTIDNRPVLFLYVTRKYNRLGILADIVNLMRQTAAEYGYDPYIIGDQVFRSAPKWKYTPFKLLDAVTNYDVRGSMNLPGNYVTQGGVDKFYAEQSQWKAAANMQGCAYVPPAVAGYNDRAVRFAVNLPAVSRRLTPNNTEGSLFSATVRGARDLVDNMTGKLMMINSFNEWHEDSQIEPVARSPSTTFPFNLTQGVAYEGYGELYLNILREETSNI